MFNLIRADLWRFFNINRLRGQFWSYALGAVLVAVLCCGLIVLVQSSPHDEDLSTYTASITSMLANIFAGGGLYALACGFCASEFLMGELKAGYIKNIVSGTRGKLAYFAAKLVFCCIACAALLAALTAASLVCALAFHMPLGAEPIARVAGWLALTWLSGCSFAILTAAIVWLTRSPSLGYAFAFVLSCGWVRELLIGLAHSSGGALRVLQPIAPVLEGIATWLPSAGTQLLGHGGAIFDMPAVLAASAFTNEGPLDALPVNAGVQVLIIGMGWIALASALALAIARKRDVA